MKECDNIDFIREINDQFDYEDTTPHGEGDNRLVSCGQSNGYNEIERFYDVKLAPHVGAGTISHQQALTAICETCHEIPHEERTHAAFKDRLRRKLKVKID